MRPCFLPCGLALVAAMLVATSVEAAPTLEAVQARFIRSKAVTLKAMVLRRQVMDQEEACVAAAQSERAMHVCLAVAKHARQELGNKLKAEYEALAVR